MRSRTSQRPIAPVDARLLHRGASYLRCPFSQLFRSGEAWFERWILAIDRATRTVHLNIYNFASDPTGFRVARALAAAAERGVIVRVLYDAVGTSGLRSGALDTMEASGVSVRAYRAPQRLMFAPRLWVPRARRARYPWSPIWNRRNHRKFLVIDGSLAFCGGANVAAEYEGVSGQFEPWLDYGLALTGPLAQRFDLLFAHSWRRTGAPGVALDARLDEQPTAVPEGVGHLISSRAAQFRIPANRLHADAHGPGAVSTARSEYWPPLRNARVAVLAGGDGLPRKEIFDAYARAFSNARSRLWIWSAYFLPPRRLRLAIIAAARRGVDVRVVIPGRSDVFLVELAASKGLGYFLKAGVRVFQWGGPMMHAKTAVVDDVWCMLGSANLDPRSRFHNAEANVAVADRRLAQQLHACFEQDIEQCGEITFHQWRQRSWWRKLAEWLAWTIRWWL